MDCEKVRDRFSALWEKELSPLEERDMRSHFASCSDCQMDFDRFNRTMRWLHSLEEVEVPEELLPGIWEKMKSRKGKAPSAEGLSQRWLSPKAHWKLPIQAVAMVAVLFLAIYLTKMVPMETSHLTGVTEKKASEKPPPKDVSPRKPPETSRLNKVTEREAREPSRSVAKKISKPSPLAPPLSEEKKIDALIVQEKREEGETGKKAEKMAMPPAMARLKATSPQEIVLRTPDREKALLELQTLVKALFGEIVTAEGSVILVSLPRSSFPEFEKGLTGLGSGERVEPQREAQGRLGAAAPRGDISDTKDRISLRIVLLQE